MNRQEAIQIVKNNWPDGRHMLSEALEYLIPELKEGGDERVKQSIIKLIKMSSEVGGFALHKWEADEMLAWLEKQGEQNLADKIELKFKVGDWVVSPNGVYWHIDKISNNRYEVTSNTGESSNWPLDTNIYHGFTIQDAKDGDVLACNNGWTCIFKTLVDDENFSSYCFMDNTKWFCETGSECHTLKEEFIKAYNGKIYPATKEQRDTLLKAMTDAGYTFDFKKKELRKLKFRIGDEIKTDNEESLTITKIDEKGYWSNDLFICGFGDATKWELVEQKPVEWSEEDEDYINDLIKYFSQNERLKNTKEDIVIWLKSLKDRVLPKQEWTEEDESMRTRCIGILGKCYMGELPTKVEEELNWLKSLRPQNQWQPSDEQMNTLEYYMHTLVCNEHKEILFGLYTDLKKLREE